jgi:Trypsin
MVIVGGTNAVMGEAPWQVLIENMNNAEICGGAIINELFILGPML